MDDERVKRDERLKFSLRRARGQGFAARTTEGACRESARPLAMDGEAVDYFRCLFTSFVISNIETLDLPPKIGFRFSSALICRRFLASCRPFRLMYAQSFLVTSVRGSGAVPTTIPSWALGVIAFMNAAFGVRFAAFLAVFFAPDFAAFLAPPFFAAPFFAEDFLAPPFFAPFFAAFFAAMLFSWDGEQVLALRVKNAVRRGARYNPLCGAQ